MRNTQNITIVLLVVSAVVLTGLLVAIHMNTGRTANAEVAVKQGRWIVVSAAWSSSYDLVYVVDIKTRRLNAYVTSRSQRRLQLLDSVELEPAFRRIR